MLFIDYSSAFNTIVPYKLITKLRTLGLNTSLCNWILDFDGLPPGGEGRQQHIHHTDPQHGGPQGCVLSPLLYFTFTHNCVAAHWYLTMTAGPITNDDETAYREELRERAR